MRHVDEYLDWQEHRRGRTPDTMRIYRNVLGHFVTFLDGRQLDDVGSLELEHWIARTRRGGRNPSAATQQRDATIVRGLYRYCVDRGYVEKDPTGLIVTPTVRNEMPRPVPDATWRTVVASPLIDRGMRFALTLGYYAGLRRTEIVSLTPEHVNRTTLEVVGFRRKGHKDSRVNLSTIFDVYDRHLPSLLPARAELEELVRSAAASGTLIPWAVGKDHLNARNAFNRRLRVLCGRLEVSPFTPHQLRHSAATNLIRAGVPLHLVRDLLDHSDVQTTMRYLKGGADELRSWLEG